MPKYMRIIATSPNEKPLRSFVLISRFAITSLLFEICIKIKMHVASTEKLEIKP
jgi:hypothetical protein